MLEKKGDAFIGSGLGLDFNSLNIHTSAAWSPIEKFGMEAEYVGKVKGRYDQVSNGYGSLIYYIPWKDNSSLEFKTGYGWGRLKGSDNLANYNRSPRGNQVGYIFAQILEDGFVLDAKHTTNTAQVNYNFYQNEKDRRITMGIGSRAIRFSDYLYKTKGDSLYATFSVVTLDPFIELNQNFGRIVFNARISHSFLPKSQRTEKRVHPNFSKTLFSFGFLFKIDND